MPRLRKKVKIWTVLATIGLAALASLSSARAQTPGRGRVYVILWLVAGDPQTPQADMAAKRLAVYLTQQGITATFLISGETARSLDRRGRQDVIGALGQHEIAYYSEKLAAADSGAGPGNGKSIVDLVREERAALDDVRRVLGRASVCYAGAGTTLAPEIYRALEKWGIRLHFHQQPWPNASIKPFWYEGILNLFASRETVQLQPGTDGAGLAEAKARFQDFCFRVSSRREATILNVIFCPADFVEQDRRAGSTELPPLKSPEASEKAFSYFESLVTYIKASSGVEFMRAARALYLLRDTAQRRVYSRVEVGEVARSVEPEVSYQVHEDFVLTPSEQFYLLTKSVAGVVRRQTHEPILLDGTPLGPASSAPASPEVAFEVSWDQFAAAVESAADYIEKQDQVPDVVRVGNTTTSPASFLVALARVTGIVQLKGESPEKVELAPAHLNVDKSPEAESGGTAGNAAGTSSLPWLSGPQAWTFKPARFAAPR